ncbi:hypothetical protein OOK29_09550 [Streptomyces phaeochromogenes]|uniref:hypothetical protein n=1 Tax=Streptomyces phaeochromogenes TaxID=1923 RepID=UPI00224E8D5E|nr:hypothetical protein [Streptomyces phaeochromogenes]MCX5598381.1 hypothetical protein [Streptomyces phaeochromogenes]
MNSTPEPQTTAAEPFPIWVVWREDEPAHGYFATEDIAKRATIDCWEEDEPKCPDYSWRRDGPRWELVVGGEHGGVYASRHLVYGGAPAAPVPPAQERRDRYAKAIRDTDGWVLDDGQHMLAAVLAVADAEQAELRARHKASLRRADELNNQLMEEVQRYADGTERPVLWSVYNAMHKRAANAETRAATLAPLFEGFGRLLATSSRDWGQYAPDAWLYAVICGWDCEEDVHDETCTHGAMEEMAERHGWDYLTVAKARRYRAAVRAITDPAAVLPQPETQAGHEAPQPWHAAPETEEEKLAKARRMGKALAAPRVAPPEWAATEEWPMRHKRARDRRVHATAGFQVHARQEIWTACGRHIGRGGYPLSHMPVDCRACRAATAPAVVSQPDEEARWCKCPSCWGWFAEEHPGEDLDELGRDLSWWSGLPEHRDAPAGVQPDEEA